MQPRKRQPNTGAAVGSIASTIQRIAPPFLQALIVVAVPLVILPVFILLVATCLLVVSLVGSLFSSS